MHRKNIVTRRAGVTASALRQIGPKRVFHMLDHWFIMIAMSLVLDSQKKLEHHSHGWKN
jgi:hypothetical protein